MAKRLFDIALVILTAEYWLPLMAVVAIAIVLFDGGPVFFLQQRAGKGGKPFNVLKFKTMVSVDGGEPVATPLGKWLRRLSLDEIPQLINVLLGHMSLVGPRPLPVKYLPRYSAFEARRHEVRPGITGWAQVHRKLYETEVLTTEHTCIKCQFGYSAGNRSQSKSYIAFHFTSSHLCINHIVVHGIETKQTSRHFTIQGERRPIACS